MKLLSQLSLITALLIFSSNSFAEVCEGINACTELYTKLTGEKIIMDKDITDEMTLAAPTANFTSENAKAEYRLYLNKNAIALTGSKMDTMRNGDFLISPIYIVSENNMPQMINKDGLVTLVYHAKNSTKKLTKKVSALSKKKMKGHPAILEFPTNVIAVEDTFEYATRNMNAIIKADK
jgi:hypothetical protein